MRVNRAIFSIRAMCRVLEVSASGYYAWCKRERSVRARENEKLQQRIETIHRDSRQIYGAPRIHAELLEEGTKVSRKRIARLMKAAGLAGVSRRKWTVTTQRDRSARPAPDLVDRNFVADKANARWVADITYIPTWTGFLYLAVVLDVWSRKIVGWAMESHQAIGQRHMKSTGGSSPMDAKRLLALDDGGLTLRRAFSRRASLKLLFKSYSIRSTESPVPFSVMDTAGITAPSPSTTSTSS